MQTEKTSIAVMNIACIGIEKFKHVVRKQFWHSYQVSRCSRARVFLLTFPLGLSEFTIFSEIFM